MLPLSTIQVFFEEIKRDRIQPHILQFSSLLTLLQYRKVYDVALRQVSSGAKVLDWGCGNGHFSFFLTRQNIATTGFSFEPPPSFLLGEPRFRFIQGDPNDPIRLTFSDASFDVLFSIGVLEHVHETGGWEIESLKEIRRVLKPGGLFLCFHFPNKSQWVEPVGKLLGIAEHFHKRKYSRDAIKHLTEESGFFVEEIGRYNFFPRNQLRILPHWLSDNLIVARLFEWIDMLCSFFFPFLSTNFYFVARPK